MEKKSYIKIGVISAVLVVLAGAAVGITFLLLKDSSTVAFDKNFKFGAASASYQIEGGWDADGKSPSIWDEITHKTWNFTADKTNGDVSANSYYFFDKDIAALNNIGFEFYRFSIAWSRIIPDGTRVNMKGVEYYNKLIDGLIERGIEPVVTMYHWDLPQYIQDLGGFTNPLFVDYFTVYADTLFRHFGDRVKTWITFNEPYIYCNHGYGLKSKAPGIESKGVGDYLCAHHTLIANAAAYKLYKEKYSKKQNGRVGICLFSNFAFPEGGSSDRTYADKYINFHFGIFAHAIFSKDGGYPQIMVDAIATKSSEEKRPWSRLPEMTAEMKDYIKGTADFLALNYYTSRTIKEKPEDKQSEVSWAGDMDVIEGVESEWKRGKSDWLYQVPDGLHGLLNWIKDNYDNPEVIISENGWSDSGEVDDFGRIEYLQLHLQAVSKAIDDGCKVTAYTAWSLTDNFEWAMGYEERFGLHYINFYSEAKTRIPKKSALFFKDFLPSKEFKCEYC